MTSKRLVISQDDYDKNELNNKIGYLGTCFYYNCYSLILLLTTNSWQINHPTTDFSHAQLEFRHMVNMWEQ